MESFDENGEVFSTLKTDIFTVSIHETQPLTDLATFTSPVVNVAIVAGTKQKWSLPNIDSGVAEMYAVQFEADPLLSAHLKYNYELNEMVYDGKAIAGLTRQNFVNSKLSLVTTAGENLYT